jgi:N-formylglutamate deformylase
VKQRYPFLISVPHGGTEVPELVRRQLLLSEEDILYYCDPATRTLFGYQDRVAAYIETPVSRMVVDLNRPPLPLPLRDPDGIIKIRTIDGREVWRPGQVPDMQQVHDLLRTYYFPFHQQVDELIDRNPVKIAFDCHSMLPYGSEHQKDAGKVRPLICLGNNGDRKGRARKGSIATCSRDAIITLAALFEEAFPRENAVAINNPFSGGFIANAHFWHKGIPWIQIEVNRALYEHSLPESLPGNGTDEQVSRLKEQIWKVLTAFWNHEQGRDG